PRRTYYRVNCVLGLVDAGQGARRFDPRNLPGLDGQDRRPEGTPVYAGALLGCSPWSAPAAEAGNSCRPALSFQLTSDALRLRPRPCRDVSLAHPSSALGKTFLRRRNCQIVWPNRHLAKLANSLRRYFMSGSTATRIRSGRSGAPPLRISALAAS